MIRALLGAFLIVNLGCAQEAAPPEVPDVPVSMGARNQGEDWPGFLGPRGDSTSAEKGIISPWPTKTGLRILWHMEVGEGYAMPSIADGKLYHFDRHVNKARLTCMSAETGKELWRFEYPTFYRDYYNYSGGPRCCPVIDGDRVYLHGVEGMLYCLSAKDGKEIWKIDTVKKYDIIQNFFGVGSTPIIEGDLLIVQIGGSPKGSEEVAFNRIKGNGTGVIAFDKKTGEEKWRASDELASYVSPRIVTIEGKRRCLVFARGGLLMLDPKTGEVSFHFPWRARDFESVNASNPVVSEDHILISETYGPGSAFLKIKDGKPKVIWSDLDNPRDKSMQCHWMTPILVDGYLYGSSGRHESDAELRCIELATGKVKWSVPDLTRSSLLKVEDKLICLSEDGTVRLLKINPEKYEVISTMTVREPDADGKLKPDGEKLLQEPCWAAPILSHGLLYLKGDGHLVCCQLIPK